MSAPTPPEAVAPPARREAAPFGEVLGSLRMLSDHIRVVDVAKPEDGWIGRDGLLDARAEPLTTLLERIGERYTKSRRHAAAVSFMLRFGWSVGPMIAAHLGLHRGVRYLDYALRFAPDTAIEAVCIGRGELLDGAAGNDAARRALLDELIAHTEPVLEALHHRSAVSRGTLWSMVTSIWAAQFIEIGERLGDLELGQREALAMFELRPKIRRAAPVMYGVTSGDRRGVCQIRGACCLSYSGPNRQHCMVCPMISADERARRNSAWLASRPPVRRLDPALLAAWRRSDAPARL